MIFQVLSMNVSVCCFYFETHSHFDRDRTIANIFNFFRGNREFQGISIESFNILLVSTNNLIR